MLLYLACQADRDPFVLSIDGEGVIDVGQLALFELGVKRRADHLGDSSSFGCGGHLVEIPRLIGCLSRTAWGCVVSMNLFSWTDLLEGCGGAHDVGKLAGDLALPGPVVLPGKRLGQVGGVLSGS